MEIEENDAKPSNREKIESAEDDVEEINHGEDEEMSKIMSVNETYPYMNKLNAQKFSLHYKKTQELLPNMINRR